MYIDIYLSIYIYIYIYIYIHMNKALRSSLPVRDGTERQTLLGVSWSWENAAPAVASAHIIRLQALDIMFCERFIEI